MIRDEEIEAVIVQNLDDMTNCVDHLIHAALEAAGADNCTVAVCQIISGGTTSDVSRIPKYNAENAVVEKPSHAPVSKKTGLWIALIALLCAIISGLVLYFTKTFPFNETEDEKTEIKPDAVTPKTQEKETSAEVGNNKESTPGGGQGAEAKGKSSDETRGNSFQNIIKGGKAEQQKSGEKEKGEGQTDSAEEEIKVTESEVSHPDPLKGANKPDSEPKNQNN